MSYYYHNQSQISVFSSGFLILVYIYDTIDYYLNNLNELKIWEILNFTNISFAFAFIGVYIYDRIQIPNFA